MNRSDPMSTFVPLFIIAILSIMPLYAMSIEYGYPSGVEEGRSLSGIYWPNIGRDHNHRSQGIPASRGIRDPVIKWDQSANQTSPASAGAEFTGNVVFSGTTPVKVFGIASSNATHLMLRDGESGELMWSVDVRRVEGRSTNRLFVSPTIVNTDSDQSLEILVCISDGNLYQAVLYEPRITLNATGYSHDEDAFYNDRVWISDPGSLGAVRFSSPVPYDLTGDGVEDILFGAGNYLVCLNGVNGSLLWHREIGPFGEVLSAPAVLVGTGMTSRIAINSLNSARTVLRTTLVNFNGLHLNNITYSLTTPHPGPVPMPSIGDLTGDGFMEIVVNYPSVTGLGRIRVFTYTLSLLTTISSISGSLETSSSLADMDDDSVMEIVVHSRVYTTRALIRMYCFEIYQSGADWLSRSLWSVDSTTLAGSLYSPPLICDMNEDSLPDAVFFASGWAYCMTNTGDVLWNLSAGDHNFQTAGIVGDLGRDQFTDIFIDGIMISQRVVDLFVAQPWSSNLLISDPEPVEGRELTISCILTNDGYSPARNVVVEYRNVFKGDPYLIGRDVVPEVVQTRESTMTWIPPVDGTHEVLVIIDPDDNITETDEANNMANIEIQVGRSLPDIETTGMVFKRADGVEADGTLKNIVDGDPSTIEVEVRNIGYRRSGPFNLTLFIDGTMADTTPIEDLPGGGQRTLIFHWTPDMPSGGEVIVTAFSDIERSLTEVSTDNNELSENVTVKSKEPISDTYRIIGAVRDTEGALVNEAIVTLICNRTGRSVSTSTVSGSYVIDPSDLDSGYEDGDEMEIRATSHALWGAAYFRVYSQDGGKAVNINLTDVPTLMLDMLPVTDTNMSVRPGHSETATVRCINSGNIEGQVSIALELNPLSTNTSSSDWIVSASPSSFLLAPGSARDVDVLVIVPDEAAPMDTAEIMVIALMNGTEMAAIDFTLTVQRLASLLIDMTSPTDITIDPNEGRSHTIALFVENTGNVDADYALSLTGPISASSVITDGSAVLAPGEYREPVVTITVEGNSPDSFSGTLSLTSEEASIEQEWMVTVEVVLPNVRTDGDIKADPPGRILGEEIKLSVDISNSGRADISLLEYEFRVNGVSLGRQVARDLVAGQSAVIVSYWTPSTKGEHVVVIDLDPDNELIEIDKEDNTRSRTLTFLPDLIIKTLTPSTLTPGKGESMVFNIEIENRGTARSDGFVISVMLGSESGPPLLMRTYTRAVEPTASGSENFVLDIVAPSSTGRQTLYFKVGVPEGDSELDITNNVQSIEIDVKDDDGEIPIVMYVMGGILLFLIIAAAVAFILIKKGVILREDDAEPLEGPRIPEEISEDILADEPALEMKIEELIEEGPEEPVDAEVIVAEPVGEEEPSDEEEGMIPEV
ncbi:MAG: CARDB domain-containing protein [Candidatus Thermoplasmatota archaeon]|nr:CARDB domain-containing protein [Candidatus Thermoplasmatota archaeon]